MRMTAEIAGGGGMSARTAGLAVIIPARNEASTIRKVAEGALAHTSHVIVIDDGSEDETAAALDGLPVDVIRHETCGSKGRRLAEGLAHAVAAGAENVITLDADGQHDPADIPRLLAACDGSALVLADRTDDLASMPRNRAGANRVAGFFVSWACKQIMRDTQCGMRLYPAAVIRGVRLPERERRHFIFETMVLLRATEAGFGFRWVPIAARKAKGGRRSYFRPVLDITRITIAVTVFIVARGFIPRGLLIALGRLR